MAANDYVKLWIEDYKLLLEPYSIDSKVASYIYSFYDFCKFAFNVLIRKI